MVCDEVGGEAEGNSYGQWRRVVAEIPMVSAKPKIDCSKEVLVRHSK
jgi:hypothetical protein